MIHVCSLARLQETVDETGARHVVGVNSGTDALVLLLRALGLEPGDEVVVPAFTFVASATSVAENVPLKLSGATRISVGIPGIVILASCQGLTDGTLRLHHDLSRRP